MHRASSCYAMLCSRPLPSHSHHLSTHSATQTSLYCTVQYCTALYRRYSDFEALHASLSKSPGNGTRYKALGLAPPPKRLPILNHDAKFIAKRREELDGYLSQLLKHPDLVTSAELLAFLKCPPHLQPPQVSGAFGQVAAAGDVSGQVAGGKGRQQNAGGTADRAPANGAWDLQNQPQQSLQQAVFPPQLSTYQQVVGEHQGMGFHDPLACAVQGGQPQTQVQQPTAEHAAQPQGGMSAAAGAVSRAHQLETSLVDSLSSGAANLSSGAANLGSGAAKKLGAAFDSLSSTISRFRSAAPPAATAQQPGTSPHSSTTADGTEPGAHYAQAASTAAVDREGRVSSSGESVGGRERVRSLISRVSRRQVTRVECDREMVGMSRGGSGPVSGDGSEQALTWAGAAAVAAVPAAVAVGSGGALLRRHGSCGALAACAEDPGGGVGQRAGHALRAGVAGVQSGVQRLMQSVRGARGGAPGSGESMFAGEGATHLCDAGHGVCEGEGASQRQGRMSGFGAGTCGTGGFGGNASGTGASMAATGQRSGRASGAFATAGAAALAAADAQLSGMRTSATSGLRRPYTIQGPGATGVLGAYGGHMDLQQQLNLQQQQQQLIGFDGSNRPGMSSSWHASGAPHPQQSPAPTAHYLPHSMQSMLPAASRHQSAMGHAQSAGVMGFGDLPATNEPSVSGTNNNSASTGNILVDSLASLRTASSAVSATAIPPAAVVGRGGSLTVSTTTACGEAPSAPLYELVDALFQLSSRGFFGR